MLEKEKLMYDILAKITDMEAPIIFKGALITKLILKENGYNEVERATKDIDANWVGKPPTMSELCNTIQHALKELNTNLYVEKSRDYGNGKSAGLSIRDKATGDKLLSLDIDIKPNSQGRIYYFGEASIKGVLSDEILADKISAISTDAVFKHRAKDIIDIYSLSQCVDVDIKNIYNACINLDRQIYSFDAFFNCKSDVEYAYNKLKGIVGKPDFSEVYEYLSNFVEPFVSISYENKYWNPYNQKWVDKNNPSNIIDLTDDEQQTIIPPPRSRGR